MNDAQHWIDWLLRLGPEMFSLVVLVALGFVLRQTPIAPGWIPAILAACGTGYYALICGNQVAPHWVADPLPWRLGIGFVISVAAWTFHGQVVERWLKRKGK